MYLRYTIVSTIDLVIRSDSLYVQITINTWTDLQQYIFHRMYISIHRLSINNTSHCLYFSRGLIERNMLTLAQRYHHESSIPSERIPRHICQKQPAYQASSHDMQPEGGGGGV